MKYVFHSLTMGLFSAPPTAAEVAKQQLEEARIKLLEAEKEKEAAICRVDALKARVRRLETMK